MKFITSDGVAIDYQDKGIGQPVILIEGFGGYQEIWKLQVEYLIGMNCRVITYDHRNHGKSQRAQKNLTIARLTDDLAELISYLQLKEPVLIGHSMGASIGYSYLSRYHNFKTLMAIDQSPKMLNDAIWPYGFENITSSDFKEQVSVPNTIHETLHGLDRRIIFDLNNARSLNPFDRKNNLGLLYDHIQKDWCATVLKKSKYITMVVAKQSPYFDYHFALNLKQQAPDLKVNVLDNCGHDIMAEIPDVFDQTLRHFIFSSRKGD